MTTFAVVADRLGEIFALLAERGTPPAGAPFFRYLLIGGDDHLVVEAGVPVADPLQGKGDIVAGTLPAGRYVTETHHGHPDGLVGVTEALLKWAEGQGLAFDMTRRSDGEYWGCRLELFHTNPAEQPDMHEWDTELRFRLA